MQLNFAEVMGALAGMEANVRRDFLQRVGI